MLWQTNDPTIKKYALYNFIWVTTSKTLKVSLESQGALTRDIRMLGRLATQNGFAAKASKVETNNINMKKYLLLALSLASMAGTASANPFGWLFGPVRQQFGPAVRQANPWAYSGMLAVNRSIPPQVKNNLNNQLNPYRVATTPWSAELNYWRSMPPEVRNNIVRQQQHQMTYRQQQPQVIYVPAPNPPQVYVPHGAYQHRTGIPAPPPPTELPRIVRPH